MPKPKEWIILIVWSLAISFALIILIIRYSEEPNPTDFGMAVVTGLMIPMLLKIFHWMSKEFTTMEKHIDRIDDRLDKQGERIAANEGRLDAYTNVFNQFEATRKHIEERFEETMTHIENQIKLQNIKLGLDEEDSKTSKKTKPKSKR